MASLSSLTTTLPLILLIDMDGTLIGDSTMQVCRFEICNTLEIKHPNERLCLELKNGLLRPHLDAFLKTLQNKYHNIEVYVYTASEKSWALTIIPCIEKVLGFKFSRPILTRSDCIQENGTLKKSITKVLPSIARKLKCKYKITDTKSLYNQTLFIDNFDVLVSSDVSRLLLCPTYSYFSAIDVLVDVPQHRMTHQVLDIIHRYGVLFTNKLSAEDNKKPEKMMALYYSSLAKVFERASLSMNTSKKDDDIFWAKMDMVFTTHKIQSFNTKVVQYLKRVFQSCP